jgi:hypothetical protein
MKMLTFLTFRKVFAFAVSEFNFELTSKHPIAFSNKLFYLIKRVF